MPTHIYHITHQNNLPAILQANALRCVNKLQNVTPINIAHPAIQSRRAQTAVPVGTGGTLHDYVPFYFAYRQPMLYALHRDNVDGYTGGQEPLLHLVSSIENIQFSGHSFVFTDGHPTMAFTRFATDWAEHTIIDWELMQATYWQDTVEDPDRKRRRQAEFLVPQQLPLSDIIGVAVMTSSMRQWVSDLLQGTPYENWPVAVRRNWYF